MSWVVEDWTAGLTGRVLQKVQELQAQQEKVGRERQQKQLQLDSAEAALHKHKQKYEEVRVELVGVQRELAGVREEVQGEVRGRERLAQELQVRQAQVCSLEGQLDSTRSLTHTLTQEVKRLEAELEKLQKGNGSGDSMLFSTPCWNTTSPWDHNGPRLDDKPGDSRAVHVRQQLQFDCIPVGGVSPPFPQQPHKSPPLRRAARQSDPSTPSAVFPWERGDSRSVARGSPAATPSTASSNDVILQSQSQGSGDCGNEEDLRKERDAHQSAVLELQSWVARLERDLRAEAERSRQWEERLEEARRELSSKEQSLSRSKDELGRAHTRIGQESDRVVAAEQRMKQLQEELKCQRQNTETSRANAEQRRRDAEREHQRELTELQKERQHMERQHQQESNKLNQELQQARALHNTLQSQCDKVLLQKQAVERDLDTLKGKLRCTESELKDSQTRETQTQSKLTEALREGEGLTVALEQTKRRERSLEEDARRLEEEVKRLSQELADALKLISELQAQLTVPAPPEVLQCSAVGDGFPSSAAPRHERLVPQKKRPSKTERSREEERLERAKYPSDPEPGESIDSEHVREFGSKRSEEREQGGGDSDEVDYAGRRQASPTSPNPSSSSSSSPSSKPSSSKPGAPSTAELRRENVGLREELREAREEVQRRLDDLEAQRRAEAEARTKLRQLSRKLSSQAEAGRAREQEQAEEHAGLEAQLQEECRGSAALREALAARETELQERREEEEREEEESGRLRAALAAMEGREREREEEVGRLKEELEVLRSELAREREGREREKEKERGRSGDEETRGGRGLPAKVVELEAELAELRQRASLREKRSEENAPLTYLQLGDNANSNNNTALARDQGDIVPSPDAHVSFCDAANLHNALLSRQTKTADLIAEPSDLSGRNSESVALDGPAGETARAADLHRTSALVREVARLRAACETLRGEKDAEAERATKSQSRLEILRGEKDAEAERATKSQSRLEILQIQVTSQTMQLTRAFESQSSHIEGLLAELQERDGALRSLEEELRLYREEVARLRTEKRTPEPESEASTRAKRTARGSKELKTSPERTTVDSKELLKTSPEHTTGDGKELKTSPEHTTGDTQEFSAKVVVTAVSECNAVEEGTAQVTVKDKLLNSDLLQSTLTFESTASRSPVKTVETDSRELTAENTELEQLGSNPTAVARRLDSVSPLDGDVIDSVSPLDDVTESTAAQMLVETQSAAQRGSDESAGENGDESAGENGELQSENSAVACPSRHGTELSGHSGFQRSSPENATGDASASESVTEELAEARKELCALKTLNDQLVLKLKEASVEEMQAIKREYERLKEKLKLAERETARLREQEPPNDDASHTADEQQAKGQELSIKRSPGGSCDSTSLGQEVLLQAPENRKDEGRTREEKGGEKEVEEVGDVISSPSQVSTLQEQVTSQTLQLTRAFEHQSSHVEGLLAELQERDGALRSLEEELRLSREEVARLRVEKRTPEPESEASARAERTAGDREELKTSPEHTTGDGKELKTSPEHTTGDSKELETSPEHTTGDSKELETSPEHTTGDGKELKTSPEHTTGDSKELETSPEHTTGDGKELKTKRGSADVVVTAVSECGAAEEGTAQVTVKDKLLNSDLLQSTLTFESTASRSPVKTVETDSRELTAENTELEQLGSNPTAVAHRLDSVSPLDGDVIESVSPLDDVTESTAAQRLVETQSAAQRGSDESAGENGDESAGENGELQSENSAVACPSRHGAELSGHSGFQRSSPENATGDASASESVTEELAEARKELCALKTLNDQLVLKLKEASVEEMQAIKREYERLKEKLKLAERETARLREQEPPNDDASHTADEQQAKGQELSIKHSPGGSCDSASLGQEVLLQAPENRKDEGRTREEKGGEKEVEEVGDVISSPSQVSTLQEQVTSQTLQLTRAFEHQSSHVEGLLAELQERDGALRSLEEELRLSREEVARLRAEKRTPEPESEASARAERTAGDREELKTSPEHTTGDGKELKTSPEHTTGDSKELKTSPEHTTGDGKELKTKRDSAEVVVTAVSECDAAEEGTAQVTVKDKLLNSDLLQSTLTFESTASRSPVKTVETDSRELTAENTELEQLGSNPTAVARRLDSVSPLDGDVIDSVSPLDGDVIDSVSPLDDVTESTAAQRLVETQSAARRGSDESAGENGDESAGENGELQSENSAVACPSRHGTELSGHSGFQRSSPENATGDASASESVTEELAEARKELCALKTLNDQLVLKLKDASVEEMQAIKREYERLKEKLKLAEREPESRNLREQEPPNDDASHTADEQQAKGQELSIKRSPGGSCDSTSLGQEALLQAPENCKDEERTREEKGGEKEMEVGDVISSPPKVSTLQEQLQCLQARLQTLAEENRAQAEENRVQAEELELWRAAASPPLPGDTARHHGNPIVLVREDQLLLSCQSGRLRRQSLETSSAETESSPGPDGTDTPGLCHPGAPLRRAGVPERSTGLPERSAGVPGPAGGPQPSVKKSVLEGGRLTTKVTVCPETERGPKATRGDSGNTSPEASLTDAEGQNTAEPHGASASQTKAAEHAGKDHQQTDSNAPEHQAKANAPRATDSRAWSDAERQTKAIEPKTTALTERSVSQTTRVSRHVEVESSETETLKITRRRYGRGGARDAVATDGAAAAREPETSTGSWGVGQGSEVGGVAGGRGREQAGPSEVRSTGTQTQEGRTLLHASTQTEAGAEEQEKEQEEEQEEEAESPPLTPVTPVTLSAGDRLLFSASFPIPADPAHLAERIRRSRSRLSVAFDDTEYEPYGLPEVVMKGFADIPTGPACPYVLRRGLLGTAAMPLPLREPKEEDENPDP